MTVGRVIPLQCLFVLGGAKGFGVPQRRCWRGPVAEAREPDNEGLPATPLSHDPAGEG